MPHLPLSLQGWVVCIFTGNDRQVFGKQTSIQALKKTLTLVIYFIFKLLLLFYRPQTSCWRITHLYAFKGIAYSS